MPETKNDGQPGIYFLNERHQLVPTEKDGGGRIPKVVGVDWERHGQNLKGNITDLREARQQSSDPSARFRAFVLAAPEDNVERASTAQDASDGKKEYGVEVGGKDSQLIERIGFDLLSTTEDGSAVVHAPDDLLEQMIHSLDHLETLGVKEQSRWAHLESLHEIPLDYKTSLDWWPEKKGENPLLDCVVDLQPFLTRVEIDGVIHAIKDNLTADEEVFRIGREFTGRVRLSAKLKSDSIFRLTKEYQAIFSIHPPLVGVTVGSEQEEPSSTELLQGNPHSDLPCVAVLDTGIPSDHVLLAPHVRGRIIAEDVDDHRVWDSHGSYVASRVVFGDVEFESGAPKGSFQPACSVYDARLGESVGRIVTSGVDTVVDRIVSSAPDVRVFNISFDADVDVDSLSGSYRDAWMRKIADLDNRIFSNDVLVVVAAGNSEKGVIPVPPYPENYKDQQWRLRAFSRCFNALTCGGTADVTLDGVATEPGAPSPFTRVGPGLAKSAKPDFSAHAGNGPANYQYQPGSEIGVWACNESGLWEDIAGTSYAAPLLARDAARTFSFLQRYCESGTRPFACLVKACLALHSTLPELSPKFSKLANLTLGYGTVNYSEIEQPIPERAVFLWQGIIGSEKDKLTVELPVPGEWVRNAKVPRLRLFAAWDSPVNHAAEDIWACRKVDITIRQADGDGSLSARNRRGSSKYTLLRREYNLPEEMRDSDLCLMELKYSNVQMAPYPGSLNISPQQRVGIAFELVDLAEEPVSPHQFIQSLPVAESLNRLTIQTPTSRQAISLRISN